MNNMNNMNNMNMPEFKMPEFKMPDMSDKSVEERKPVKVAPADPKIDIKDDLIKEIVNASNNDEANIVYEKIINTSVEKKLEGKKPDDKKPEGKKGILQTLRGLIGSKGGGKKGTKKKRGGKKGTKKRRVKKRRSR